MTACLNTMPEYFCPLWTLGSLREREWTSSILSSATDLMRIFIEYKYLNISETKSFSQDLFSDNICYHTTFYFK